MHHTIKCIHLRYCFFLIITAYVADKANKNNGFTYRQIHSSAKSTTHTKEENMKLLFRK